MRRTKEQLRWIAERIEKYVNEKWPGLGFVMIIFDTAGPANRPINIILHGVNEEVGMRLMRENADLLEKVKDKESILVKPGPLIVPPSGRS